MQDNSRPLIRYRHALRSRYGETDKMGYVYYGRYLEYFEEARTEMIRDAGLPYSELEEKGYMLPVVHAELDYKQPIFYDELMYIDVLVYEEPGVKLDTRYEVRTENDEKVKISGQVILCFVDVETRRPCRAPQFFLDGLRQVHQPE